MARSFSAAQILPIAAALALPLIVARWGTGRTYTAANATLAFCLAALAFATAVLPAAAAYIAVIAILTVGGTSRDMLGQEIVVPRWRTTSQGVAMIGMSLGEAVAAAAAGLLFAYRRRASKGLPATVPAALTTRG